MNSQGNRIEQKEIEKSSGTKLKDMENCGKSQ